MTDYMRDRILKEAAYIIKTKATIRKTAKTFHTSKSTIYADTALRLEKVDPVMAIAIKKILNYHTSIRHIRGGAATKYKYAHFAR